MKNHIKIAHDTWHQAQPITNGRVSVERLGSGLDSGFSAIDSISKVEHRPKTNSVSPTGR